jgi:L-asparaginase
MGAKKVILIFTGGTIIKDIHKVYDSTCPSQSGELCLAMEALSQLDQSIEIEVTSFSKVPGPQMTVDMLLELKQRILQRLKRKDITGIVIAAGTDTLEESSYFIDLSIQSMLPVVFVGAMRKATDLGYDGASNLKAAIQVASSEKAQGKGVLVMLNDEIHFAAEVVKTHSAALHSFQSPYGPAGLIDGSEVILLRNRNYIQSIHTNQVERRVDLITAAFDMDDRLLRAAVATGAKGIVIEGMGTGTMPQAMIEGLFEACSKGVIVVVVSRCHRGSVSQENSALPPDVIMGGDMNGLKARIKLMLALGKTQDFGTIKALFTERVYHL